jgi:hypothetical protein
MPVRPITDTLRAVQQGVFLEEASEQLAALVKQITETGKGGKLVIELAIKPVGRKSAAISITGKVTAKAPNETPDETLMFPTPEGNLLTEDPRQQKLDLKVAAAPNATLPLKTANAE